MNQHLRTPMGYRWRRDLRKVHSLPETIIKERIAHNLKNPPSDEFKDFLDIILEAKDENGNSWTLRDIRDEVDTFIFEGHDTTATGLMWTIYCISQHPEVEKKIMQEVDEVLGNYSFPTDYDMLKRLPYLTSVIKEAQRLYPPVPYIGRSLTSPLEVGGITLPPTTEVNVFVYGIHRNPHHWPEPEKFNPDRFTVENSKGRHPFAYIPFSAGPRNCIGQNFALNEEIYILAMIYKRFYLRLVPDHPVILEPVIVLRSLHGFKMTLHKRL